MQRRIVPFRSWHFDWLQDVLEPIGAAPDRPTLSLLEQQNSYTGLVDGDVVFCAGTVAQWPTRHVAWALLSRDAPRSIKWITKEIRAGLVRVKGRIEMTVRADFPQGQKWAELLGFQVETPLLKTYGPYGEDHVGYVRVN